MAKGQVRVRGMNAAAEAAAPTDRDSRFPHASTRQLIVAVALVGAGSLIAWYTFDRLDQGPLGFTGTVEPQNSASLDFSQTARIAQILVTPGQQVKKGQPLAEQDAASANAALADAEAVLAAEQSKLAAMENPALTDSVKQALELQISQAQSQLDSAQQASTDAGGQADASVGQARQALTNAQNTYNADRSQYATACATATAPASSPPSVSTATPTAGSTSPAGLYTYCLNLHTQIQKDQAAISSAQSALTAVQANATQTKDTAASSAANAQQALAQAQQRLSGATAPASETDLAAARADVSAAQTTVDQDKAAISQLTIYAPFDATVAQVGGHDGDLDGPSGVHSYAGPHAASTDSGPAFSLFPTAGTSSGQTSGAGQQPLIWLMTSEYTAVAQVDEADVGQARVGRAARVTVNALGETVDATVTQVDPIPVDQGGTVEYDVRLTVHSWPGGTLAGMSLNVEFS
jgi:multidrug efflux pump subunit AcrA (membrane-fusion protein)